VCIESTPIATPAVMISGAERPELIRMPEDFAQFIGGAASTTAFAPNVAIAPACSKKPSAREPTRSMSESCSMEPL
jgi:hypothetical protein